MKKKIKVITAVLVVLAVASAAFMAASIVIKKKADVVVDTSDFKMAKSTYTAALSGSGSLEYPIMQTDFSDVFYLANPDGSAAFLQYSGNKLTAYSGKVKSVNISVTCSDEKIPAKVYYIERDGDVTGFGLYTNSISNADVKIHEYAFFKLTAMPKGYDMSGALLLVDFEKSNFADDKIYTEAYKVNLSNGDAERITSNNGRLVGTNGALREDWTMLTDDFLKNVTGDPLFLSGRNYNLDDVGYKADIIKLNGTRKPKVKIENILGFWVKNTKYGFAFLRSTDGGFQCVLNKNGEENSYKSFKSEYYLHYLQDGDYVANKDTITFTQLLSGRDTVFSDVSFVVAPTVLSVNPGGNMAVLASEGIQNSKGANIQKLVVCNLKSATSVSYEEPYIYSSDYANFFWVDDNTLIHVRPLNDDGTGLQYVVLKVK